MSNAVEMNSLTIELGGTKIIDNLSVSVDEGELVCVSGPTGSGKSTLLRVLTGIIPGLYRGFRVHGDVRVFGMEPVEALYRGLVAYVPQDVYSFFIGSTPREELAILGVDGLNLDAVDMDRDIEALSDGQLYRFLLFSALSTGSKVIAIDEPSSHVDWWSIEDVLSYVKSFAREKKVVVFVADHRLDIVGRFCDKTLRLAPPETTQCNYSEICATGLAKTIARLEDVHVIRQGLHILNGITLYIGVGEPVAIVGRNGAGKTTLLKVLAGAAKISRGRIMLDSDAKTFLVPQNPVYWFPSESVREVMKLFAQRHRFRDSIDYVLEMFYLHGKHDKNAYTLSIGEARMLSLALAYVSRANLILIDEPTLGLDCRSKRALMSALRSLTEDGKAVVVATHDLDFAKHFCSRYLLKDGKLASIGSKSSEACYEKHP